MKTILAVALILATGLAAFAMWGAAHARRMAWSGSQIFIHGTPVCVMQRNGGIEAAVGECGSLPGAREEEPDPSGGMPHRFGVPGSGLPPGHPPIGSDPGMMGGEGVRRIPI
ncbi:MAG: hypothetical protein OHK0028_09610 [Deltaproteobacteria bacterium]